MRGHRGIGIAPERRVQEGGRLATLGAQAEKVERTLAAGLVERAGRTPGGRAADPGGQVRAARPPSSAALSRASKAWAGCAQPSWAISERGPSPRPDDPPPRRTPHSRPVPGANPLLRAGTARGAPRPSPWRALRRAGRVPSGLSSASSSASLSSTICFS